VKAEIETYKHNNEMNKQRLQKDFEAWYTALQASQGGPVPQLNQVTTSVLDSARHDALVTSTRPPTSGGQVCPSPSSRVSEADSCARSVVDVKASASPAATVPKSRVDHSEQPVRAWGSSSQSSLRSTPSTPKQTRGTGLVSTKNAGQTSGPGRPDTASKTTGHADTDDEIAAYYAAIAEIGADGR